MQKHTQDCPTEKLSWFANHSLPPHEHAEVVEHLRHCSTCRQEVEAWRQIHTTMWKASEAVPPVRVDLFSSIERELDEGSWPFTIYPLIEQVKHRWTIALEHCQIQLRLIRSDLFWMPILLLPIALSLAMYKNSISQSVNIQAFLAALATALGMAFLYSNESDPANEMLRVSPTPPSLVLAIRCGLMFGYDLLINLIGLLPFLFTNAHITPTWFLANWLAPLCCLTAISLLLSIVMHARIAIAVCLFLWGLRAIGFLNGMDMPLTLQYYENFWHQTPILYAIAGCAVCLALIIFERRERFS